MNLTCKTCLYFKRTGHRNFGLCQKADTPTGIDDSRCKMYDPPKSSCCDSANIYISRTRRTLESG